MESLATILSSPPVNLPPQSSSISENALLYEIFGNFSTPRLPRGFFDDEDVAGEQSPSISINMSPLTSYISLLLSSPPTFSSLTSSPLGLSFLNKLLDSLTNVLVLGESGVNGKSGRETTSTHHTTLFHSCVRFSSSGASPQTLLSLINLSSPPLLPLNIKLMKLTGYVSKACVRTSELRRIIELSKSEQGGDEFRLKVLLAIRAMAEEGSGKVTASPKSFFNFGGSTSSLGGTLPIAVSRPSYPFPTTFRFSTWFRAEAFTSNDRITLLEIKTTGGAGVCVELKRNLDNSDDPTASLTITITHDDPKQPTTSTTLTGCVLFPREWYYLTVKHSRVKNFFSSSKDELCVSLNCKVRQRSMVPYPVKVNTKVSHISIGNNFDGQISTVYLLNSDISEAGDTHLMNFSGDVEGDKNLPKTPPVDIITEGDVGSEIFDFSKFCYVLDPSRTETDEDGKVKAFDVHSKINLDLGGNTIPWKVLGAKDVISSIGGIQTVLPLFHVLPPTFSPTQNPNTTENHLIPTLLFLLSSFLRNHPSNCSSMLKMNGMGIIANSLMKHKNTPAMKVVRFCKPAAKQLVDALMDLRSAASILPALEDEVLKTLLFNIPLWLLSPPPPAPQLPGVTLHATLLPVLSAIVQVDTKKVANCLKAETLLSYTIQSLPQSDLTPTPISGPLFSRSSESQIPPLAPPISSEVIHIQSVLIGMTVSLLSQNCTVSALRPYLGYINRCLDAEWDEADKMLEEGGAFENIDVCKREPGSKREISFSACKSLLLGFLYLLRLPKTPHNLLACIETTFGSPRAAVAWILTACVNSYDDEIRGIGVRTLTVFIEKLEANPKPQSSLSAPPNSSDSLDPSHRANSNDSSNSSSRKFSIFSSVKGAVGKVGETVTAALPLTSTVTQNQVNTRLAYKLLWHRCKRHSIRLGSETHDALMDMIVVGEGVGMGGGRGPDALRTVIEADKILGGGFVFTDKDMFKPQSAVIDDSKSLRSLNSLSVVLRLLRYLQPGSKEKWLFEMLTLIRVSSGSVEEIVKTNDWQPHLFALVSDILEEVKDGNLTAKAKLVTAVSKKSQIGGPPKPIEREDTTQESQKILHSMRGSNLEVSFSELDVEGDETVEEEEVTQQPSLLREWSQEVEEGEENKNNDNDNNDDNDNPQTDPDLPPSLPNLKSFPAPTADTTLRFDLSLKLYSTLLSHSLRSPPPLSFKSLETAASLYRTTPNGTEVFCKVLSHVLADLIDNGTLVNVHDIADSTNDGVQRNKALKQSASIVTAAASSSSSNPHMSAAISQWRSLTHLATLMVGLITKLGFGTIEMLEAKHPDKASKEETWNGIGGVRLSQSNIPPLNAAKVDAKTTAVTLAAQLLSLLDAFIFPSDGKSSDRGRSYGMALVRATEERVGKPQGPLLCSLIRLSLLLISHLEPCSLRFLHATGRLRTFTRWLLTLTKESSVAMGGFATPFSESTGALDRLALAVALHAHKALEKCARMLSIFETSPDLFQSPSDLKKTSRRVLKASHELMEIISVLYKTNSELLRSSLHPGAYALLQEAINPPLVADKDAKKPSHEIKLRTFLNSRWVRRFHDVEIKTEGDAEKGEKEISVVIPEMVCAGQIFDGKVVSDVGKKAAADLTSETAQIVQAYDTALNAPFSEYLNNQRQWADTAKVRDLEAEGDDAMDKLNLEIKEEEVRAKEEARISSDMAAVDYKALMAVLDAEWSVWGDGKGDEKNWMLSQHTDELHRRILLAVNPTFNDHEDASYQGGLERDREKAEKERAERKKKQEEMVRRAAIKAGGESMDDEDEDEEGGGGGVDESMVDESVDEGEEDFYLVQNDDSKDEFAWAKQSFAWEKKERVVMVGEVIVVNPEYSVRGNLLLTTNAIYFHPEKTLGSDVNVPAVKDENSRWLLSKVVAVFGRRHVLRPQALEIFFADTHEVFMSFEGGAKIRDRFYTKLRGLSPPLLKAPSRSLNPRQVYSKLKITDLWKRRKMSNFEYLMRLNILAGRSFNDITQYPVFPWVLSDYSSETINLSDPSVYRDLTKPIGAINQDRLDGLLERYADMDGFDDDMMKFLYGSHYSSPGVVLHYLIRQEPFTRMAINLQGGRFDCPDRLFFDIKSSWYCCQTNSGDFKESIPEMFSVPEILMNTNKFPLGSLQDNRGVVNDVILPPWAKGSAHEFIRIQRLALESDYVSEHLNYWIDLIFGYKQRGADAIKANNLFHALSYEGAVDIDKIEDPTERKAAEAHIQNFGQCPSQLLTRRDGRHPKRSPPTECWTQLLSSDARCQALEIYHPATPHPDSAITAMAVHSETLRLVYSDATISTMFFTPQGKDSVPFTLKSTGVISIPNAAHALSKTFARFLPAKEEEPGALLMSGFYDSTLKSYTFPPKNKTPVLTATASPHRSTASCLGTSDNFSVCGTADCTLTLLELGGEGKFEEPTILYGHDSTVTCCGVDKTSGVIVSCSEDKVVVHDLKARLFVRQWKLEGEAKMIALTSSGEIVVGTEETLEVWSVNGVKITGMELKGITALKTSGHFSSQYIVAAAGQVLHVLSLSLNSVKMLKLLETACCIEFSPPDNSVDQYIFIGYEGGALGVVCDPGHRLKCMDDALQAWFE